MLLATRAPSMLAARNAAKRAAAPVPVARCGRRAIAVRAAMPVGELASLSTAIARSLAPTAATLKALDLPETLIHWGHPGNMAVVLLAMLGYGGVFLGWTIRNGTADEEEIDKARDLHPKLTIGATVFFLLGATGGVISLVMQGKPILESPHFVSGMTGLALLSVQAMLPLFFSEGAGARTAHAFLGSSIFALLLVHGALGLKLGLSI